MLTGESMSVPKFIERVRDEKAVKQDMTNMLFSVSPSRAGLTVCENQALDHARFLTRFFLYVSFRLIIREPPSSTELVSLS